MKRTHDFSKGERGKHADRYQEDTAVAVLPGPATTRLVLTRKLHGVLEEFAERVSDDPDHLADFLSECWWRWEARRVE